jgi:low molecular weight protein-tyrosine phosphatase
LFNNILVVCVGNICRSPMAEALLEETLNNKAEKEYQLSSAGLQAMVGHKADAVAIELMLDKGLDISNHFARQLNQAMIIAADLILVMESEHKQVIETKEPSAKGRVFRLGEWGGFDIIDPYRRERKVFEQALQLIEIGVKEWAEKL